MQIYEVKNNVADILYAAEEKELFLSDFLYIEDKEQTIIGQITDISTTEKAETNLATVKFHLSVDKNNTLTSYNGHTPSKNAEVGYLEPQEILGLFEPKEGGIYWGNYKRNPKIKISTDIKFLSSNACVICNKSASSKNIIQSIVNSLNSNSKKSVILDFAGKYKLTDTQNKLSYGKDFRIPLDITALDYILNNELEELPITAKVIVQGIIIEVAKYTETLPDGFIPFDIFAQIVEEEIKNTKDMSLLIFANKLSQYKQKKLFADEKKQFDIFNNLNGSSVIDISDIKSCFHKLILSSLTNIIPQDFYVFSDIFEENIDNEIIKQIYEKNNIKFLPVCGHESSHLSKLRQYCGNFIIFSSPDNQETNEDYKTFINNLSVNDFVLYGENTLSVPILVTMNNPKEDNDKNNAAAIPEDIITTEDLDDLEMFVINKNKSEENQTPNNDLQDITNDENSQKTAEITEKEVKKAVYDSFKKDKDRLMTKNIIEDLFQGSSGKIELNLKETSAAVQKSLPKEEKTENIPAKKQENPIKSIFNDAADKQQPIGQKKQKPDAAELPIYTPKEPLLKEIPEFAAGNRVSHAKYGAGVVEKVMKYGNKTLCCIQFEEAGRKLLDPSVTLIEKLL